MKDEKGYWDVFGKWNFAFFYRLIQSFSVGLARRFLYIGLEDKSIYEDSYENKILNITTLGKTFPNPIGIAAGFDTSFKYNDELIRFGFGFEEFGTFTLEPKTSHVKMSYLSSQKGIFVDQPCFGNRGIKFAQKALIERRHLPYIAGLSISSNTEIMEHEENSTLFHERVMNELIKCVQITAPYCDYITLNLSHPLLPISYHTINLGMLNDTIRHLKEVIQKVAPISKTKLLIKVPLDIDIEQIPYLCETAINADIDGIIVGGYLKAKKDHKLSKQYIRGYLSGRPIKDATTQIIEKFYAVTGNRIPLIASGGVFTGDDAYEKIISGASLLQVHSSIIYTGPSVARKINKRLAELLQKNGFKSLEEAVGSKFKSKLK